MSDHEPRGLTPREIECLKLTSIMSSKEMRDGWDFRRHR